MTGQVVVPVCYEVAGLCEAWAGKEAVVGEPCQEALTRAADLLGCQDSASLAILLRLWDDAFEQGRLAALDELQDRFCVCMK